MTYCTRKMCFGCDLHYVIVIDYPFAAPALNNTTVEVELAIVLADENTGTYYRHPA